MGRREGGCPLAVESVPLRRPALVQRTSSATPFAQTQKPFDRFWFRAEGAVCDPHRRQDCPGAAIAGAGSSLVLADRLRSSRRCRRWAEIAARWLTIQPGHTQLTISQTVPLSHSPNLGRPAANARTIAFVVPPTRDV